MGGSGERRRRACSSRRADASPCSMAKRFRSGAAPKLTRKMIVKKLSWLPIIHRVKAVWNMVGSWARAISMARLW